MAHLRAFSFTDDSCNVTFPTNPKSFSFTSTSSREQEQIFLQSLDPAVQLLQLRQMQSPTYQKLFMSGHQNIKDPWPTMSDSLHEMHLWMTQVPNSVRKPMKKLFHSEILFASVLVLSPPRLTFNLQPYSKALLFGYACEFADTMSSISGDLEKFAFYTSYDILRVSFVAGRFLAILRDSPVMFLDGPMPDTPPSHSGLFKPPTLPTWDANEVLNKTISCLKKLGEILKYLGDRYDSLTAWGKYQDDVIKVEKLLSLRQ